MSGEHGLPTASVVRSSQATPARRRGHLCAAVNRQSSTYRRPIRVQTDGTTSVAVEAGALLEVVPHPNPKKYPRQKVMVVEVIGYAYLVPFVEEEAHFFLKTIIPSRKATRDFIAKESDDV